MHGGRWPRQERSRSNVFLGYVWRYRWWEMYGLRGVSACGLQMQRTQWQWHSIASSHTSEVRYCINWCLYVDLCGSSVVHGDLFYVTHVQSLSRLFSTRRSQCKQGRLQDGCYHCHTCETIYKAKKITILKSQYWVIVNIGILRLKKVQDSRFRYCDL